MYEKTRVIFISLTASAPNNEAEMAEKIMNYREQLQHFISQAQIIHRDEKEITSRSINVIRELERRRAPSNCGMRVADFARHIGLSEDQYLKRSAAARTLDFIPEARPLFDAGEISLTHLSLIAAKITRANRHVVLEGIRGKSLRESKLFLSRVTPSGELLDKEEVCEVRIILTKNQIAMLERAREVLAAAGSVPTDSDIVSKALDDLLRKRDPLRKAERAASAQRRRETASTSAEKGGTAAATTAESQEHAAPAQQQPKSRYVPAAVRHQVWMRDQGQCKHRYPDGTRCGERMMLELDHRDLFCRGGDHSLDNLELKCRQHNHFAAEQALGPGWYQDRVQRETEEP